MKRQHKVEARARGKGRRNRRVFSPLGAIFEDGGGIMGTKRAPLNVGHSGTGPSLCVVQCFSGVENHSSHCNSGEQRVSHVRPPTRVLPPI